MIKRVTRKCILVSSQVPILINIAKILAIVKFIVSNCDLKNFEVILKREACFSKQYNLEGR